MDHPETLGTELKTELSLWRNADQNENQGTHEIELLQTVMSTATQMQKSEKEVVLGDLVAKAARRSLAKIQVMTMTTIAHMCVQYLEADRLHLLQEIVEFHSMKVNPRELVVSTPFLKLLLDEEHLRGAHLLKMYILFTQYTLEKCKAMVGGPAYARFLDAGNITNLAQKA